MDNSVYSVLWILVSTAYYGYYKYDVTVVGVYVCHKRVASTVLLRA